MSYDPNKIMGLDALSPTVAAYKQFIERQNNVGDPNVVQFLASRGEPQLAGLIAKKMRVDNAAKAQQALAQQPQSAPPTVAQKYEQAAQQQVQQAIMAQMQQAHHAQAAPGLAGMPNPAMDQASFAGGGIVAFADGGDVQHFANQGLVNAIRSGGVNDLGNIGDTIYVNRAGEATSDPYAEVWKEEAERRRQAEVIKEAAAKKRAAEAAARTGRTAAAEEAAVAGESLGLRGILGLGGKALGLASFAVPAVQAGAEWVASHPDNPAVRNFAAAPTEDPLMAAWGVQAKEPERPTAPPAAAATAPAPSAPSGGIAPRATGDFQKDLARAQADARVNAPRAKSKAAAPADTAPADTAPAAPTSKQADIMSELERLIGKEPTKPEKTPVVSKALDNEQAWIKQHQEDYASSKKEAQKAFFINLGASLLGNRSPFFATALGEALSQSYGTLSQDLRSLKKENDALALQELKVQQAREELQAKQDRESQVDYNKALSDWKERTFGVYKLKEEINQDVLNRASREKETAATLKSHEKIANITAGYREDAADTAAMRARVAALGEDAKTYRAVLNNPLASAAERADAQKQLTEISHKLNAMGSGGGGVTTSGW